MKKTFKALIALLLIMATIASVATIIRAVEPKDYHARQAWEDVVHFLGAVQFATVTSTPDTPSRGTSNGWIDIFVNRDGTLEGDTMDVIYKSVDSNENQKKRKLVNEQANNAFEIPASGDTETWNGADFPDTPANSQAYFFVLSDTPLSAGGSGSGFSYTAQLGDVVVVSADTDGTVSARTVSDTF